MDVSSSTELNCPLVCLYWIMLSAVDDPDLGQRVEFVYVRGVYVYPERVLRFILYLFQGDGVDDPRRSFREARGLEGATCQHDHDQHRHDYLRPVTCEGAGPMSSPRTWTTRSRLERSVFHRTGYQDTRVV